MAQRRQSPPPRAAARTPAPRGSVLLTSRNAEDGATETLVQFEPVPIELTDVAKSRASLAASFTRAGEAQPQTVSLVFFFHSPTCIFDRDSLDRWDDAPTKLGADLLVDGARLHFDRLSGSEIYSSTKKEGVRSVSQETEGHDCAEGVSVTTTAETFAKIAAARGVTGSIGTTAFRLTPSSLSALRELGGQIKSAATARQ
jgi:hypothetical protein